jgi:hypothetical protein
MGPAQEGPTTCGSCGSDPGSGSESGSATSASSFFVQCNYETFALFVNLNLRNFCFLKNMKFIKHMGCMYSDISNTGG